MNSIIASAAAREHRDHLLREAEHYRLVHEARNARGSGDSHTARAVVVPVSQRTHHAVGRSRLVAFRSWLARGSL